MERRRRYSVSSREDREVSESDIVVMDCGTSYMRIGFDGDELPRLVRQMTDAGSRATTLSQRSTGEIQWDEMREQWRAVSTSKSQSFSQIE